MANTKEHSFNLSVLMQIRQCQLEAKGFLYPAELQTSDYPLLLQILLSTLLLQLLDLATCQEHMKQNFGLICNVNAAYRSQSFWQLRNHPLICCFQRGGADTVMGSSLPASSSSGSLKDAFEEPYQGDHPRLFKKTLDLYAKFDSGLNATQRAYNKSISVVQSSGMGKSRLVEELGNLVFTIPINLCEDVKVATYPPSDNSLRNFFEDHLKKSNEVLQAKYAIFLIKLFEVVGSKVAEVCGAWTGVKSAIAWANHMKEGQNMCEVGSNRKGLYEKVVKEARGIMDKVATTTSSTDSVITLADCKVLVGLFLELRNSGQKFQQGIAPGYQPGDEGNMCYVYFDEAHVLAKPCLDSGPLFLMSPYHNLGKVLAELCSLPIFFIFLSTNSNLHQLAPSPFDHPSLRVSEGCTVFPPFTELPFDVFADNAFNKLAEPNQLSLAKACTTDVILHFGQPMWSVHHKLWSAQQERDFIRKNQNLKEVLLNIQLDP